MIDTPSAGNGPAEPSHGLPTEVALLYAAPEALLGVRDGVIATSNRRADVMAGRPLAGRPLGEVLPG